MATPKRITKEQAEVNKKKQQVLRKAGYNIKVDGSWGPWQEKQYRKVISNGGRNPNQANVGVMALPMYGYGAAQLLKGLGSVSLPSISIPSASAHAMAAPVALTLAGPAYGAYETLTGKYHQIQSTPQERQAQVYAPDATRVSRPIVLDFPRKVKSRPIGERYINPILSREATRSRHLATEAANDSIATIPVDTAATAAPVDTVRTSTPSASPSQEPENNKDKKKDKKGNSNSWFKLWEGSGTSGTPKHPNFWKHVRNFGVRVPLYTGVAAPAIDVVGNMISASREPEGQVHQWKWPLTSNRFSLERGAWKLFGDAYSNPVDSTKRNNPQVSLQSQEIANPVQQIGDTIVPVPRRNTGQVTTSTPNQLDSINKAWFGE